jgi:hypothetical protein
MAGQRVNTATLIRGEVYTLRHPDNTAKNPVESLRFEYGEPVVITDKKILDILENLHDITFDGDGEEFEKPRFRVDRNVPHPDAGPKAEVRRPTRLKSDRKVKSNPRRRAS